MIFPDNARVCFIGDSITAANKALPVIIDTYRKKFPERKVRFFNCGTSGAQLFYALKYFEEDIAACRPTHAVIAYGMNDAWLWNLPYLPDEEHYNLLTEAYDTYRQRLNTLCGKLESIGVKDITVCTPSPYNEYGEGDAEVWRGGAAALVGYSAFVREFAREKGYSLCDYNSYLTRAMQTQKVYNPEDRVHPSDHGYYLMAKCFLESQGIEACQETPVPEYLKAWCEKTEDLRDIHYVENNIIENRDMSQEEKYDFVREYLKRDGLHPDFISKGNKYFENRSKSSQFLKETEEIYDRDILKLQKGL